MWHRYRENDDIFHRAAAHYGYGTERYKIIYFYNDGLGLPGTGTFTYPPEWELHDLQADPQELRNVYDDPECAELREKLKTSMWRGQRRLLDGPHPSQAQRARLSRSLIPGSAYGVTRPLIDELLSRTSPPRGPPTAQCLPGMLAAHSS